MLSKVASHEKGNEALVLDSAPNELNVDKEKSLVTYNTSCNKL